MGALKGEEPLWWYGKKWFTGGGSWDYIAQLASCPLSASWLQRQCDQLPHAPVSVTMRLKNKTFLSHVVLLWQKDILMPHLYCSAFCYCNGIPEPVSLWRGMGYLGSQSSGFWSMSILLCCFGPVLRHLITEEYVTELTSWLEIRGRGSCWATSRDLSLDLAF